MVNPFWPPTADRAPAGEATRTVVELPLLPGHTTRLQLLLDTTSSAGLRMTEEEWARHNPASDTPWTVVQPREQLGEFTAAAVATAARHTSHCGRLIPKQPAGWLRRIRVTVTDDQGPRVVFEVPPPPPAEWHPLLTRPHTYSFTYPNPTFYRPPEESWNYLPAEYPGPLPGPWETSSGTPPLGPRG